MMDSSVARKRKDSFGFASKMDHIRNKYVEKLKITTSEEIFDTNGGSSPLACPTLMDLTNSTHTYPSAMTTLLSLLRRSITLT